MVEAVASFLRLTPGIAVILSEIILGTPSDVWIHGEQFEKTTTRLKAVTSQIKLTIVETCSLTVTAILRFQDDEVLTPRVSNTG